MEIKTTQTSELQTPLKFKKGGKDDLAAYIVNVWECNKEYKRPIQDKFLRNLQNYRGIYPPDKKEIISKAPGGSTIFVKLTAAKCMAAEAAQSASYRDKYYGLRISPTPVPEISPEDEEEIVSAVVDRVYNVAVNYTQEGGQVTPEAFNTVVNLRLNEWKQLERRVIHNEAVKAANRMQTLLEDVLSEGGFASEMKSALFNYNVLGTAILKSPVIENRQRLNWVRKGGKYRPQLIRELQPAIRSIDPFDIYPSYGMTNVDDGDIIERSKVTIYDLNNLKNIPSFDKEAIDYLVTTYPHGYTFDKELDDIRDGTESSIDKHSARYDVLNYYGNVSGELLKEYGVKDVESDAYYFINAHLVADRVIKVTKSLFNMSPYTKAVYRKGANPFFGDGISDVVEGTQTQLNAIARIIMNNSALSSLPQTIQIVEHGQRGDILSVGKTWDMTIEDFLRGVKPLEFFNIPANIAAYLPVYNLLLARADEETGIVSVTHGGEPAPGINRTASGASLYYDVTSRPLKESINVLDEYLLAPAFKKLYDYMMEYHDDPSVKGDTQVETRSLASLASIEQQMVAIGDIRRTLSAEEKGILGAEGLRDLLAVQLNNVPALSGVEILPDDTELSKISRELKLKNFIGQDVNNSDMTEESKILNEAGLPESGETFSTQGNVARRGMRIA